MLDIAGGGYDNGRIILIGGQSSKWEDVGLSGDFTENYYMEIDSTEHNLIFGPQPVGGLCYYQLPSCYGDYKLWQGNLYEVVSTPSINEVTGEVEISSTIGLIDVAWTSDPGYYFWYDWIRDLPDDCSPDADIAFGSQGVIVAWTAADTCRNPFHGAVKQWIGESSNLLPDRYYYHEEGFDSERIVAVAAGHESFALFSGRKLKIFNSEGAPISNAFDVGTYPDDNPYVLVGYGGGYYAVVFPGGPESESYDRGEHLQVTLVKEDTTQVQRYIIYCDSENEYPVTFAYYINPVGLHWMGTGFSVAFIADEAIEEDGEEITSAPKLYLAWVPVP